MEGTNGLADYLLSIASNFSQKGRTTKAELGDDLAKHLPNLLKCTWYPESWWRCLCPLL